jgi:arylsulfatase
MLHAKPASPKPGSRCLRCFLLSLVLISFFCLDCRRAAAPPAIKYNLLVISIDTCRADHLTCYGYNRDTSPHLDQLAKEGVLFEDVTAASSWTVPSHMSMFTSLYPSVHKVQEASALAEGIPTLAECLAKSGYVTAAFVSAATMNHWFGFNRGFQFYDDYTVSRSEPNQFRKVVTGHLVTEQAAKWLQKHSRENFFLFLHYFDCHGDYISPAPFNEKFDPDYKGKENGRFIGMWPADKRASVSVMDLAHIVALYDGGIAYTDEQVGKIFQLLQDLRLSEKTLVIVLSDHGEGFLEHGLFTHGNSLYEELLRVPLILRLPGVIPAGKRVAGNVSHVDLMPTVMGLLQQAGPLKMQGIDLSPAILGDQPVPERLIYSELAYNGIYLRAVRWGNRKLLGSMKRTLAGAQLEELVGGREKVIAGADLKKDCPEAMLRALTMGPASIAEAKAGQAKEPDADLLSRLKSLGYAQ